jgi:hypothetical protein
MRLFLAFQYPMSIPGVSVANFLRRSLEAVREGNKPLEEGAATQHGIANLAAVPEPHLVILTGFVVAFLAGWVAIRFFMRYVNDHKLTPFAYYCWAFGLGTLAILLARGHGG